MTTKAPWPIPAFKDRNKNECPRCKRVVPRDAVALRPAARDGLALGRDVALELESRISDALDQAAQKLDSFTADPFDFFTAIDAIRFKLLALGRDYLANIQQSTRLELSRAEWDQEGDHSVPWSVAHSGEIEAVRFSFVEIGERGEQLTRDYLTLTAALRESAQASWVEMDSRLRACLRLVNRSRDFYDHLLTAQTAGDLAKATQQQALTDTWNELATELAGITG